MMNAIVFVWLCNVTFDNAILSSVQTYRLNYKLNANAFTNPNYNVHCRIITCFDHFCCCIISHVTQNVLASNLVKGISRRVPHSSANKGIQIK